MVVRQSTKGTFPSMWCVSVVGFVVGGGVAGVVVSECISREAEELRE